MSNTKNKSQEAIEIQKLETKQNELDARRIAAMEKIALPGIKKQALAAFQQERINLLAQGIASGITPDTSKVDAKIEAATKDEKVAIEQAEAARVAIALLDKEEAENEEQIARIKSDSRIAGLPNYETNLADFRQRLSKVRHDLAEVQSREGMLLNEGKQLVQDYMTGRVEKSLKTCEEVMPLLRERLSTMLSHTHRQEEGAATFVNKAVDDVVVIGEEGSKAILKRAVEENDNLNDVLRRMELQLASAAPYAEMLEVVWDESATKRALIKYLGSIGRDVRAAVIAARISAPEWAFVGENFYAKWVTSEKLEPVKQFLNDSGMTW